MRKLILVIVFIALSLVSVRAFALDCFPGAEGWGVNWSVADWTDTTPDIYHINTLTPDTARSTKSSEAGYTVYNSGLEAALEATGARIVVFDVSGTIQVDAQLNITNPYIIIAGQTAPSPGITIRGATIGIRTHHVLIQHLRFRVGESPTGAEADNRDAMQIEDIGLEDDVNNVVIDHCSLSWSVDETLSFWYDNPEYLTVSNCILSEPLNESIHSAGAHAYGMLLGDNHHYVAIIGNLFAHSRQRCPRITDGTWTVVVNNVIYNWDNSALWWDLDGDPIKSSAVGNVFIKGASSNDLSMYIDADVPDNSEIYYNDNLCPDVVYDDCILNSKGAEVVAEAAPEWPTGFTAMASGSVKASVLANAGARPDDRDTVDTRIVTEVTNETGGVIDCVYYSVADCTGLDTPMACCTGSGTGTCVRNNEAGWPTLTENTTEFSLPANPHTVVDSGYSNLEELIHAYAGCVEGDTTAPVISGGVPSGEQQCTSDPRNISLQITTDELVTCKYDTSDDTYANLSNTFTTTGGTSHSQALSLACNASYTYYCRCQDTCGNANGSSTEVTFSIESSPPPPVNVTGACYGGGVSGGSL